MSLDLQSLRTEYTKGGLEREDLHENPIEQFNRWMQQTVDAQLPDPNAMTIATVDATGQPSQRIVLLKQLDERM